MARRVKCFITGEYGDSDHFVKIGKHYYKSQEVYDEDKRLKQQRKDLIDYICRTFLGYGEGQPFPTYLGKRLKKLEYYDDAVILETFKQYANDIRYWLSNKSFDSEFGKVSYMFAIVEGHIADVNRKYITKERAEKSELSKNNSNVQDFDNPNLSGISKSKSKNLSAFLDGDDL